MKTTKALFALFLLACLAPGAIAQSVSAPAVCAPPNNCALGSGSTSGGRGVFPGGIVDRPRAIIDMTPVYAPAINDRYDANGSGYNPSFASSDAISDFGVANGFGDACGDELCQLAIAQSSTADTQTLNLPGAFRALLCRDSSTGPIYNSCTGGSANCVSTHESTSYERNFPLVIYDADLDEYTPYGVSAVTDANCQGTGNFPVTVVPALARGVTTADSVAPLYEDNVHFSAFGSRVLGQYIAQATVESVYTPRGEDLPGLVSGIGTMETDCATTGWVASGAGVSRAATVPTTTEYSSWKLRNAVWGSGCGLTGTVDNGDWLTSPAFATVPGRVYAVRFLARTSDGAGNGIAFDVLDSGGTPEASVYDFAYGLTNDATNSKRGWHGVAHGTGVGCQTDDRDGTWQMCVAKFKATSSSAQLRVGTIQTVAAVYLDEVYAFQADLQTVSELTPIIGVGAQSVTLDGDSQFANTAGTAPGRIADGFAWAMTKRPGVTLTCPVSACARGHGASRLADLVDVEPDPSTVALIGYQRYRTKRPALAIFESVVNDFGLGQPWGGTTPASPNTAAAAEAFAGAFRTIASYAGVPIWITPQPWAYATGTSTVGCSGWQCSVTANKIVTALLHDTSAPIPIAVSAADPPTDGQVPKWNAGGTVTWENDAGAGTGAPTDATYITQTANGTLTAEQALSALATGILKSTTGTGVVSIATAGTDYCSPSSTDTLTNKTLNAESTGNVVTIPVVAWLGAASCQGSTATLTMDSPASNAAAAACITGTNTQKAVADFDATTAESLQFMAGLPGDWTGAIDVGVKWLAAATSGSVAWCAQVVCVADAETDDPAFPAVATGNCVSDAAKGTTLQANDATISGVTATGCAAGELAHFRVSRDPAEVSTRTDTMTGDARLLGVSVTLRRAM